MKKKNFGIQKLKYFDVNSMRDDRINAFDIETALALRSYKENRINQSGNDFFSPFPDFGFSDLNIVGCNWQSPEKWPDSDGRHWFQFFISDGKQEQIWFQSTREVNDFYWIKDPRYDFPKKDEHGNDCWHYGIGHRSGTEIFGFSLEPDYTNGVPNENQNCKYLIKFTDESCKAISEWVEEQDEYYRRQVGLEPTGINVKGNDDFVSQNSSTLFHFGDSSSSGMASSSSGPNSSKEEPSGNISGSGVSSLS